MAKLMNFGKYLVKKTEHVVIFDELTSKYYLFRI